MCDVIGGADDPMRDALAFVARLDPARGPIAVLRDRATVVVCLDAIEQRTADGDDGLALLDDIWHAGGFWAGAIAYDLGRAIEQVGGNGTGDRSEVASDADRPHDVAFTCFATRLTFTPRRRASFD